MIPEFIIGLHSIRSGVTVVPRLFGLENRRANLNPMPDEMESRPGVAPLCRTPHILLRGRISILP